MLKNFKKLVSDFFEKVSASLWEFAALLENRLKTKKTHLLLKFNQSQWLKPYVEFNTEKSIEVEKSGVKDERALYKIINNSVYAKTMEKLRNRIVVKLLRNKIDYFKWTSKPSYM